MLLEVASAYEAASKRRISPPAFPPLRTWEMDRNGA
jgi:hypothetical protein